MKNSILKSIVGLASSGASVLVLVLTSGCGNATVFNMASDSSTFQQNSVTTNGKVDVLFVMDNSGTMASSQANVAANFQKFIQLFNQRGVDYRIAVTTTEAYRDLYVTPASFAQFRDGTDKTSHTGVRQISSQTPNLEQTFLTNIIQGTDGSGDERAFQSLRSALSSPSNTGFPRADAFLAVIIVSDEDDFSVDTSASTYTHDYAYSGLHKVETYVNFLDTLMGTDITTRSSKYNVNVITVSDKTCLDKRNADAPNEYLIGVRYMELATKTNGIIGSLCSDFGVSLSNISNKIIELTTQFYLGRPAVASTLAVYVNGGLVPQIQSTDPQPWNGFLYRPESKSLTFFGRYVPQPAAIISVDFVPSAIK